MRLLLAAVGVLVCAGWGVACDPTTGSACGPQVTPSVCTSLGGPTPSVSFTISPNPASPYQDVTFTATTHPVTTSYELSWGFNGSGHWTPWAQDYVVTHQYEYPATGGGSYTVNVWVQARRRGGGDTVSATKQLTISVATGTTVRRQSPSLSRFSVRASGHLARMGIASAVGSGWVMRGLVTRGSLLLRVNGSARVVFTRLQRAAYTIRLDLGFGGDRRLRTVTGVMLLRFGGRSRGVACVTLRGTASTPTAGLSGVFSWLGGTGSAAGIAATGPARLLVTRRGMAMQLDGALRLRASRSNRLPGACQALAAIR